MPNPWFRLYSEFATDPKVQMLSESDQRRLIMLFCIRCGNGEETLHDDELMFQMRVSPDEWARTKSLFVARGFIDQDNNLLNWSKRQYESDSSTARVRAFRERQKQDETLRNVPVSPPDTDTDTENQKQPTDNARATMAMREAGCSHVNPSHPDLLAALAEGVTPEELADTAREFAATKRGPPLFAYAIATARSRRAAGASSPKPQARAGPRQPQSKTAQALATLEAMKHGGNPDKAGGTMVRERDSDGLAIAALPAA